MQNTEQWHQMTTQYISKFQLLRAKYIYMNYWIIENLYLLDKASYS